MPWHPLRNPISYGTKGKGNLNFDALAFSRFPSRQVPNDLLLSEKESKLNRRGGGRVPRENKTRKVQFGKEEKRETFQKSIFNFPLILSHCVPLFLRSEI